jgi:prepilin-type processing-associated H-X9-DG protein
MTKWKCNLLRQNCLLGGGHGRANHPSQGHSLYRADVVVAIPAILAAVLMPVYANARKKARQVRCAGSLHQIGSAIALYQADHDGGWTTAAAAPWGIAIEPYVHTDYLKLGCTMARRGSEPISHVPGYAMNNRSLFHTTSNPETQFPSKTIAFCDANWQVSLTASADPWMTQARPIPAPESAWIRHPRGVNYLFCDPDIKWYPPQSVLPAWIHNQSQDPPTLAVYCKP